MEYALPNLPENDEELMQMSADQRHDMILQWEQWMMYMIKEKKLWQSERNIQSYLQANEDYSIFDGIENNNETTIHNLSNHWRQQLLIAFQDKLTKGYTRDVDPQRLQQVTGDPDIPFFMTFIGRAAAGVKDRTVFNIREQIGDFELVSVTVHQGATHTSGHWVCYFKCDGQWYKADDSGPSVTLIPDLNNTYENEVYRDSSLLVYVRRN